MTVRSIIHRLPPIARRDAIIAQLKDRLRRTQRQRDLAREATSAARLDAEAARAGVAAARLEGRADAVADAEEAAEQPSWRYKRAESARRRTTARGLGAHDPVWKINDKVAGYRFARSHGLDVPEVLTSYDDIHDIAWDDLPDGFVVKARGGAGSHGVVPIQRRGNQVVDLLDTRRGPVEIADVVEYFETKLARQQCTRSGVVEELLRSPYGDDRALAPDLKLYCFYGEVGMIMIRDVGGSRNMRDFRTRYIDADGADLGEAIVGRAADPTLPGPLDLKGVVDVGTRVSAAIPTPFIRLDLFERPDSIVFGEITPRPGGNQTMRPDLDREFGRMWEDAESRLRAEAIRSGAADVRFGDAG